MKPRPIGSACVGIHGGFYFPRLERITCCNAVPSSYSWFGDAVEYIFPKTYLVEGPSEAPSHARLPRKLGLIRETPRVVVGYDCSPPDVVNKLRKKSVADTDVLYSLVPEYRYSRLALEQVY